jgi:hypothetical protein
VDAGRAEGSQGRAAEDVHAVCSKRFPAAQPGRCDGIDSNRTDWVRRCSQVYNNPGLCGPVVNLMDERETPHGEYINGIADTNLGNVCPTASPTSAPTVTTVSPTTVSPTSAPTVAPTTSAPTTTPLPCCERLRLNSVFCCLEKLNRTLMAATCQECGTK